MSPRVGVVIPYYQKRPGILARAVRSALRQEDVDDVVITVVDNLSPVPAAGELRSLTVDHPGRIRLVTGPRPGPGAARNTGLDALRTDTQYVAFLDSDDEWEPNHLRNAIQALEQGFDFYFADFFHLGQSISAFHRTGCIDPARHRPLGAGPLYAYRGDMFDQILSANVIGTSTVVYRRSACRDVRFDEEYSHAGEDYLFWLEVASRTSRFAFSIEAECHYGEGVNVYSGSGWGTAGALRRTHCEMKYQKAVSHRYALSPGLLARNRREVRRLRKYFVAVLLHRLLRREPIEWAVAVRQVRLDIWIGILFAPLLISIAGSALKARVMGMRGSASGYIDTRH